MLTGQNRKYNVFRQNCSDCVLETLEAAGFRVKWWLVVSDQTDLITPVSLYTIVRRAGMTSTERANNKFFNFWRDWFGRIGFFVLLISIVDFFFLPDLLRKLGLWPKPRDPAALDYLMFTQTLFMRSVFYPIIIAFLLLVVAAGRLLRRKKIL